MARRRRTTTTTCTSRSTSGPSVGTLPDICHPQVVTERPGRWPRAAPRWGHDHTSLAQQRDTAADGSRRAGDQPRRRDQGLRAGARRARHRPRDRAGRDRRVPRPQRRRQDHHHRHAARALAPDQRLGRGARPAAAAGDRPRAGRPRSCRPAACSRTSRVRETVAYTASLFADTQPVDEVLEHAGISGIAGRKVGKCSGGEQQRLRFAMALLSDPALLLLDEPTTGMDVEGRRAFWSAIRADAEKGRTVLFATHYLEEADQYADRIVLMRKGRIVADGTASQVKALAAGRHRPGHPGAPRPPGAGAARRGRVRRGPRRHRAAARQGHRRGRPLPAHRRPTPATWRSPPAASRTRSSR